MRITGKPETAGASGAAPGTAQEKPRTRFSEVLEEEQQRNGEDQEREAEEPKKRSAREPLLPADAAAPAPAFVPLLPFSAVRDVAPVYAGQGIAAVELEALLTSLVQEIAVVAPPDRPASVDIQFNSRTLEGLHVRVQKAGDSVEVRFSTSSEAVSRLLTANADRLAEALVQQGYAAPAVSVQHAKGLTPFFSGESGRSGRDGGGRGKQDQGRGGKRR